MTDHATTRAHIQAEIVDVRAQRLALKLKPGTHAEQADMLADIDRLLDRLLALEPEPA